MERTVTIFMSYDNGKKENVVSVDKFLEAHPFAVQFAVAQTGFFDKETGDIFTTQAQAKLGEDDLKTERFDPREALDYADVYSTSGIALLQGAIAFLSDMARDNNIDAVLAATAFERLLSTMDYIAELRKETEYLARSHPTLGQFTDLI